MTKLMDIYLATARALESLQSLSSLKCPLNRLFRFVFNLDHEHVAFFHLSMVARSHVFAMQMLARGDVADEEICILKLGVR